MSQDVKKEIGELVNKVLADYNGTKNIDATDTFNKPDRNEIIDITNNHQILVQKFNKPFMVNINDKETLNTVGSH